MHRHKDVIYNQIHQGITRGVDGERENGHDVDLCPNVAYSEPTGQIYYVYKNHFIYHRVLVRDILHLIAHAYAQN